MVIPEPQNYKDNDLKRVYSLEEFEYMVEKFQEIIQSYLDM
jgi:hypothetical protein